MAYGSDSWNANILAKGYKYTSYDNAGFLHGSNISQDAVDKIVNMYNSSAEYNSKQTDQLVNDAKALVEQANAKNESYYQQSNEFNSAEAQKNRDWQEYMSNTSYQRAVQDLEKAGLNPILAYQNGGASSGSGSSASSSSYNVDSSSVTSLLSNLISTKLNNANTLAQTDKNNATNLEIAKLQTSSAKDVAKTQALASMYSANASASASRYNTDTNSWLRQNFPDSIGSFIISALGGVDSAKDIMHQIFYPEQYTETGLTPYEESQRDKQERKAQRKANRQSKLSARAKTLSDKTTAK